ncbi:hypothetical protein LEP48_13835 [Isoptericola sp. NEAU-Y5]|uniref:Uncharacterized protein n=1 Tax=Isoptericola luteus TaxID=2879484 RepID=A0ABS7ZHB2_9MICO|nr:hypothetical protein [Isoptericola sp. NEAU-Y5]MCA5894419.1 hypothetical protein [Isoptericola sp. NEAU-Y5]
MSPLDHEPAAPTAGSASARPTGPSAGQSATAPGAPSAIETELTGARRAVVEHRQQTARRDVALAALREAEAAHATARAALDDETADVARLESLSLARVWTALRGTRDQRLDAERAEQQAAQYVAATAQARVATATRELAVVDEAIRALGDVETRWAAALAAKEAWVHGTGGRPAAELADLAERAGALRAQQVEIAEAQTAALRAQAALDAAAGHLRSADGWSTYDTFFDGGMLASMVKHDKLDRAAELLRQADAALQHLSVELGDLGERGVGGVGIDGLTRTLDVWFDNIFTDWSVRNRIAEAIDRVRAATTAVQSVRGRLDAREGDAAVALRGLAARREAVLLA